MSYKATIGTKNLIKVLEEESVWDLAEKIIGCCEDIESIYNANTYIKISEKELNEKYINVHLGIKYELFKSMSNILAKKIIKGE